MLLLHALGVFEDILLSKEAAYLGFLQSVENGAPQAAFQFLSSCNETELAEKLLLEGVDAVQKQVRKLVKAEFNKLLNKKEEQRCRILIPKSRLLFGICDPRKLLRDGECFVRITSEANGKPTTIHGCDIIVTRNPCLHPGDIQKYRVVNYPELAHLVDCIVFPTQGRRASADKMSGGDLDGDQCKTVTTFLTASIDQSVVFVSWDPEIIPSTVSHPADYPGAKEPISFGPITEDDRLKYFAGYNAVSLGRVKNIYMHWARARGPLSPECQQLNRLFSQCVDGNRIKVPPNLENCPTDEKGSQPFILDVLHGAATMFNQARGAIGDDIGELTFDALQMLLCREDIVMSEFELIKLSWTWCLERSEPFTSLLPYFDFGALTDEQKAWTIAQLPPDPNLPALVTNGLLQSNLLASNDLKPFDLQDPRLHWKCVFDSTRDRMANFLDSAAMAMERFSKKLIVFQVDARMACAVLLQNKMVKGAECSVDDSVRVFTFPRAQLSESPLYRVKQTTKGYKLYCDGGVFQLFNNHRGDTWVYLVCGPQDTALWRSEKSETQRRQLKQKSLNEGQNFDCRASIAMNKISSVVQKHVGRVNRNGILGAASPLIWCSKAES